ncbi:hypothetical protein SAMN05421827_10269 [Pedobacter terrae]|uniref:Immunity protein 52 domain-containing protein n=1 Tax=Pedobacter terrae TaxID=405671 RepID=A0A1G7PWP4_9SPHI|nr:hypothetical protein [Pedobacter terrae]SDF90658.1 hypothetical protein SAMN05421827_10269 [Pedobacter terrae]
MKEKVMLRLRFDKADLTADQYINFCKNILKSLMNFDSYFSDFGSWNLQTNSAVYFSNDFEDFHNKVFQLINDENIAYINPNSEDKDLHDHSISPFGFRTYYTPNSMVESNANISIDVSPTSSSRSSFFIFEFPSERIEEFINSQFAIALLKHLQTILQPIDGTILTKPFFHKVNKKDFDPPIGWITYIKDSLKIKEISVDVVKEFTSNGVILVLKENCPDSNDIEYVNKAIEIRDFLEVNQKKNW